MLSLKQFRIARKLKAHGMRYPNKIVREAARARIPYSLGAALAEQETGNCANIFGHDPTIFAGAGQVTRAKYLAYKRLRGTRNMQGVGPLQLTWWATQDAADRIGGCWKVECNLRVGYATLASLIRQLGYAKGCERYNGSGPAAVAYSESLRAKARKWDRIINQ